MKQKLQLPHRKRDIHESRAANTRPHFVFLVFMATIEKGSLHTYSKLKKGYHTWESIKKKIYNFWWHPDFLPLLAHTLTWESCEYNSNLT